MEGAENDGVSNQRRLRRLPAAALAVTVGLLLLLAPLARPAAAATSVPLLDTTFATLLNSLRGTLGIGTLTVDNELAGIARTWSAQMASSGTLSHNGALSSQATGWAMLGENVGTGGAVTQIFNALVASPPHMKNMSNGQFTRIGIGTVTDGQGRLWTTHVFMRPKTAGATAAPAPAPAAAPVTKAPAPVTTPAPRPAPPAAPATVPPTTAAPVAAAPAATAAVPVQAAASAVPVEAPIPAVAPVMDPASATPAPSPGVPPVILIGIVLLALLVLGSGGFLLRRSSTRTAAPALPDSIAAPAPPLEQDLTKVLGLLYS